MTTGFAAQNFLYTTSPERYCQRRSAYCMNNLSFHTGINHRVNIDAGYKDVKDDYAYNKRIDCECQHQPHAKPRWPTSGNWGSKLLVMACSSSIKKYVPTTEVNHDVPQEGVFFTEPFFHARFTINPALRPSTGITFRRWVGATS